MVPERLLIHQVTVVTPATGTDSYGNAEQDYGAAAARRPVTAWLEQDQRREQFQEGRDPLDEQWLMVTNDVDVTGIDRIEWDGHPSGAVTFDVAGPPAPVHTPRGRHHLETTLRITEG